MYSVPNICHKPCLYKFILEDSLKSSMLFRASESVILFCITQTLSILHSVLNPTLKYRDKKYPETYQKGITII